MTDSGNFQVVCHRQYWVSLYVYWSHLTCAFRRLSAQSKASSQDPDQRCGQLHAGSTPSVEPGPQQDGEVSHLQTNTTGQLNLQQLTSIGSDSLYIL